MNNYSLELQFLHLKPAKLGRTSLIRKSRSNPRSALVLSDKGVDPLVELKIKQVIERQFKGFISLSKKETQFDPALLKEAYETCKQICSERSTTYYLGSFHLLILFYYLIKHLSSGFFVLFFSIFESDGKWFRKFADDWRKKESSLGSLWYVCLPNLTKHTVTKRSRFQIRIKEQNLAEIFRPMIHKLIKHSVTKR